MDAQQNATEDLKRQNSKPIWPELHWLSGQADTLQTIWGARYAEAARRLPRTCRSIHERAALRVEATARTNLRNARVLRPRFAQADLLINPSRRACSTDRQRNWDGPF